MGTLSETLIICLKLSEKDCVKGKMLRLPVLRALRSKHEPNKTLESFPPLVPSPSQRQDPSTLLFDHADQSLEHGAPAGSSMRGRSFALPAIETGGDLNVDWGGMGMVSVREDQQAENVDLRRGLGVPPFRAVWSQFGGSTRTRAATRSSGAVNGRNRPKHVLTHGMRSRTRCEP